MARALGLTRDWAVAIVGIGNLGSALARYQGFAERGFAIVGLFDADPAKVGMKIDGLEVEPLGDLEEAVAQRGVSIGVVAVPAGFAQEVADRLVAAGVRSILNFAPIVLSLPSEVEVRRVDLSTELQILSFYLEHGHSSAPAGINAQPS
jgi:redox-sensing transcriptional repressor